jgi:hypothetical protein
LRTGSTPSPKPSRSGDDRSDRLGAERARYKDEILEIGGLSIHDEEAFPEEIFPGDVLVMYGAYRTAGLDDDLAAPREVPPSPEPS